MREGTNAYADTLGGEFAQCWIHTGADDQPADEELVEAVSEWTTAHRLRGTAYLYTRLKYDQDVFPGGVPTITALVNGRKVYDPRDTSTAFSNNPALCIRDYLTNTRYGRGIDSSLIDDTSFSAAANYCDETVTIGGQSVARYTCDGVVDTGRTSLENIKELLTACRGFLIFSGGKYKLVIDKPETATFTFNEDNIVGGWAIGLGNKQNTFNRVRINYYNPDRDWQADVSAVESTALRTIDNGLLLEREIELPYTASEPRAKAIATMALNQSRQQVSCEFTATIEGMRCEVGDVVYISHKTPGWDTLNSGAGKKFRVIEIALQSTDEVQVKAIEYDETVYDFGTIPASDPTPNTNLPDPSFVVAPTNLTFTETLYFNA
jgi:predicted phage tail protein